MARQLPQPDGARRLDFIPRSQFKAFHKRRERWACLICHRRCGKTHATIADLVIKALGTPGGRYAYIAPLYNQAKTVAWDVLKAYSRPFWEIPPNEAELHVDLLRGARISLFGGDNPDRLRGPGFDGVVLDEYADISPSLFPSVVRPALADRGGFATIIGTVRGRNHLWMQYEDARQKTDWYTTLLKASQTGQLSQEELASARDTMSDEQYASEFECDPYAAIVGAFYGKDIVAAEEAGRITVLPPEPGVPVHTAWDLGHRHSTSIWFFQVVGPEVRIVDFYENHGLYADHYCGVVAAKGYLPGMDFVPHDARVHEWGTGKTRIETLIALGRKPQLVPDHKIEDGINAAHLMFKRCWFDELRCASGSA